MLEKNLKSFLCIIAGAVLVLFPYSSMRWIMMILGAMVIVYGISCINRKMNTMATEGIVSIVIGLFLIISPQLILSLLPMILGIVVLVYGIMEILKAVQNQKSGSSRWLLDLIIAAFISLLGISLVTNPFGLIKILVKIAGVLVIYEGAAPLMRQNNGR